MENLENQGSKDTQVYRLLPLQTVNPVMDAVAHIQPLHLQSHTMDKKRLGTEIYRLLGERELFGEKDIEEQVDCDGMRLLGMLTRPPQEDHHLLKPEEHAPQSKTSENFPLRPRAQDPPRLFLSPNEAHRRIAQNDIYSTNVMSSTDFNTTAASGSFLSAANNTSGGKAPFGSVRASQDTIPSPLSTQEKITQERPKLVTRSKELSASAPQNYDLLTLLQELGQEISTCAAERIVRLREQPNITIQDAVTDVGFRNVFQDSIINKPNMDSSKSNMEGTPLRRSGIPRPSKSVGEQLDDQEKELGKIAPALAALRADWDHIQRKFNRKIMHDDERVILPRTRTPQNNKFVPSVPSDSRWEVLRPMIPSANDKESGDISKDSDILSPRQQQGNKQCASVQTEENKPQNQSSQTEVLGLANKHSPTLKQTGIASPNFESITKQQIETNYTTQESFELDSDDVLFGDIELLTMFDDTSNVAQSFLSQHHVSSTLGRQSSDFNDREELAAKFEELGGRLNEMEEFASELCNEFEDMSFSSAAQDPDQSLAMDGLSYLGDIGLT
eukprot:m.25566 g.25566  ORF g.25566 m.25566 type:complete len:558 (+) comp7717_c0_seq1:202-1875(+)